MPSVPGGGALAGFIREAAQRGLVATQALSEFRGAGGSIRTQNFYREWGSIVQSQALEAGWTTRDLNRLPRAELMGEWHAGTPGRYAYRGTFDVTDNATGLAMQRHWTIISDRPISPATAMRQAFDEAVEGVSDERYDLTIGTPQFVGVDRMLGALR